MRIQIAWSSVLLFAAGVVAQRAPAPPPSPPHLLPVVPPPVDHPAYVGQPLMPKNPSEGPQSSAASKPKAAAPGKAGGAAAAAAAAVGGAAGGAAAGGAAGVGAGGVAPAPGAAPAKKQAEQAARVFQEKRVVGNDLKKAVATVTKGLVWHKDLADATAEAAARGVPVLWIQALGELDGFA